MTTIRSFINQMAEIKAEHMNISREEALQLGGISIIFTTNNGVKIFLDMCDAKIFGLNSRNVFRKISFEILESKNESLQVLNELSKYGSFRTQEDIERFPFNSAVACFSGVPERIMNEFLQMNGGIDVETANTEFTRLWDSFNEGYNPVFA